MITSIGKISYCKDFWGVLPSKYPIFGFLTLGPQEQLFILKWLNNFVDFRIVTTPAVIAGKSDSYVAFLEYGVPSFCKNNELSFNFEKDLIDKGLTQINGISQLEIPPHKPGASQIKITFQKFVDTLNNF
jgi:hypothetical protein